MVISGYVTKDDYYTAGQSVNSMKAMPSWMILYFATISFLGTVGNTGYYSTLASGSNIANSSLYYKKSY